MTLMKSQLSFIMLDAKTMKDAAKRERLRDIKAGY